MVRRKKTSMFVDAKESSTVLELKKMIRGITKRAIEDMKLYKDELVSTPAFYASIRCYKSLFVLKYSLQDAEQ
jgi:hypothetical protein